MNEVEKLEHKIRRMDVKNISLLEVALVDGVVESGSDHGRGSRLAGLERTGFLTIIGRNRKGYLMFKPIPELKKLKNLIDTLVAIKD